MKKNHKRKPRKAVQVSPAEHDRTIKVIAELTAFRNQRDWTWHTLAEDMNRRGYRLSYRALHRIVRDPIDTVRVIDRTLYKLEKYLTARRKSAA